MTVVRAALACLAVGSLVACGGGGGGVAPGPKRPVGPAIDPATAQQGASDLITEIYDTLGRGNKDSVFTLLEDSLIVFGPRGGDMMGTRADALVALGQVVDPKAKKNLAINSVNIEVMPAPGGHSALAFDPAILNGQPHTILAVLDNTNDLWLVGTVVVAQSPTEAQLKAELAKDAVVPPAAAGVRKLDPAARPAVEKFQRGLLDQAAWGDELTSQKDAIVIGPVAGEVARGKQAIRELWKKRVAARTRAAVAGEITAAVTGDGQLAWVSAPLTRVEGEGTQPLPLRAFAVYQRAGDDWKLLALEESIAFSAPGAGASFKRFLPPKPVEPKAPEVIAARSKDGGTGKGQGKTEAAKERPEGRSGKTAFAAAEPRRKKQPDVEEAPRKKEPEQREPEKKVTAKEARADEVDASDESPRRKRKKRSFGRSEDDGADASRKPEPEPEKKVTAKEARADEADASDESPRRRRKKRSFGRSDDESAASAAESRTESKTESSKKQKLARAEADEESPRKKSRAKAEADEESPKKQKLARSEAAEEESPRKKSKSRAKAEADEESPKKKQKLAETEAEEETPRKKAKAKSKAKAEDAEEESPKKKKVAKAEAEEEESPKKKKSKAKAEADEESPKKKLAKSEEEEAPKKKAKAEAEEEAPKKKSKAKAEVEATEETPKKKSKVKAESAEEEAPKKKSKAKAEDAEEAPKKKKKPAAEAEDEVEVID